MGSIGGDPEVISFDPGNFRSYPSEEIFDSVYYVPLVTKPGDSLSDISRLFVNQSFIYVANFSQNKIFLFDHTGEELRALDRSGFDTDQYVSMQDVSFFNECFTVFDQTKGGLYSYDYNGVFIGAAKINSPEKSGASFVHCRGRYYFDRENVTGPLLDGKNIALFDSIGLTYDSSYIPIHRRFENISVRSKRSMLTWMDSVFFVPSFTKYIYAFSGDQERARYELKVPSDLALTDAEWNIPRTEKDLTAVMDLMKQRKTVGLFDNLDIGPQFVIFNFFCSSYKTMIYSKSSKSAKVFDGYTYKNGISGCYYPLQIAGNYGQWLIGFLDGGFAQSLRKDGQELPNDNRVGNSPVLVFFKLKSF